MVGGQPLAPSRVPGSLAGQRKAFVGLALPGFILSEPGAKAELPQAADCFLICCSWLFQRP